MSNPLRMFRRYQKQLIVFFGILLMVSFLITDFISSSLNFSRGEREYPNQAAVKWNYGAITNGQLQRFKVAHYWTVGFLQQLAQLAATKGGQPKDNPIESAESRAQLEGISIDEVMIRTMALAKRAEEAGMVLDDPTMESYLGRLCDNEANRNQFETMISNLSQGRMMYRQLLDHLRIELLAQQMRTMARSGLSAIPPRLGNVSSELAYLLFHDPLLTPGMAYDYHKRVHREVKAQLLPIKVDDYVSQVTDEPTEAELRNLYAEGKDRYPSPSRPEPGFRQRQKIAFEYLKADFEKFLADEKPRITDDQIRQYYEDEKEFFRELELPAESNQPTSEKLPEQSGKSPDQPPSNDEKVKTEEKASNSTPAEPSTKKSTETSTPEDNAGPSKATAEDAKPTKTTTDGETSKKTSEDDTTAPKTDRGAAQATPESAPPKYKPLEKVSDDIRRLLAAPKARDRMKKALDNAAAEVKAYYHRYITWEQETSQPKPQPPEMNPLAQKHGLEYRQIPLTDITEIGKDELGDTLQLEYGQERQRKPYSVEVVGRDDPVGYVYWKTDETERAVPELDAVRDEVIAQWRRQRAAKLAREEAEAKAEKARQSKKRLKEVFGEQVIEPAAFSWMSTGGGNVAFGSGQLGLSDVTGVDMPGREFMQAVFSLRPEQITVARNEPQTIFYVVQVVSDELKRNFLDIWQPSTDVTRIARAEQREFFRDWLEELELEMGIRWQRDPE